MGSWRLTNDVGTTLPLITSDLGAATAAGETDSLPLCLLRLGWNSCPMSAVRHPHPGPTHRDSGPWPPPSLPPTHPPAWGAVRRIHPGGPTLPVHEPHRWGFGPLPCWATWTARAAHTVPTPCTPSSSPGAQGAGPIAGSVCGGPSHLQRCPRGLQAASTGAGLTSDHAAWIQTTGLLAPVGANPRAWWEVAAGLRPDIQNLRDRQGREAG